MNYAVVIVSHHYLDCSLFGGFNAACRYADSCAEAGYMSFIYRNYGHGSANPYFSLVPVCYSGVGLAGFECPAHLSVIYRTMGCM